MTTLADLPAGASATVRGVTAEPSLEQRILEMGLLPGVQVKVLRFAPLGDPMEIRVMGYSLSLRRSEAACIEVEAV
ncbi:MAG: ferrous iron transport protein A [Planctomycetes bacterium]|nr:ferrous iron transport protein A [Planctomycetota bacterium]MCW8135526.1 ferrous iron transport protein A [Planctomycetota bacterium]